MLVGNWVLLPGFSCTETVSMRASVLLVDCMKQMDFQIWSQADQSKL